jgi:hypothetical protein
LALIDFEVDQLLRLLFLPRQFLLHSRLKPSFGSFRALQKNGASALGLQQVLGLKRHETAWTLLHKLRRAMVRSGRDLRTGRVEMAEFYIGLEEGLPGWLNLGKALIVVPAQEDVLGIGRIPDAPVLSASAARSCSLCRTR